MRVFGCVSHKVSGDCKLVCMLKIEKRYKKIFLISFLVVTLVSLFIIDSHSPLEIEFLRVSWFGKILQGFILPGEIVFFWPFLLAYQGICSLLAGCPGMLDGGPGEPYFFSALSLAVGALYAGVLMGCMYVIDRVRSRRK
jgi:hypothetical protein